LCVKYAALDMSLSEYENKLAKRTLYAANSLVYVLMPFDNGDENSNGSENAAGWQEYLDNNKKSFDRMLLLLGENETTNNTATRVYDYLFVSYLGGEKLTNKAINHILGSTTALAATTVLLDGDVVKDSVLLERSFCKFINNAYRRQSNTHLYSQPLRDIRDRYLASISVSTPPIGLFTHEYISKPMSLASLVELSLMRFFDSLAAAYSSKQIHIPIEALLNEYNQRLDSLVRLLTEDYLRAIAWPVPEFLAAGFNDECIKYWNTRECFTNVIQTQFRELIRLNEIDNDCVSIGFESQNELITLESVENRIFNYLNNLLKSKISTGHFPSQSECIQSVYQLENAIKLVVKSMREKFNESNEKIAASSSSCTFTSNNSIMLPMRNISNEQNRSTLIKCADVEWFRLLLPILRYLIANGFLVFRTNKKIYLDRFYIYCNLNRIKLFDWLNNRFYTPNASGEGSELHDHDQLCAKYKRKGAERESNFIESNKLTGPLSSKSIKMKRRFSDETVSFSHDISISSSDEDMAASDIQDSMIFERSKTSGPICSQSESIDWKGGKSKRLMIRQNMHESPPIIMDDSSRTLLVSLTNKNVTSELEKKLEGLVNNLQEEKQNFNQFEMKLNETLRSEVESNKTKNTEWKDSNSKCLMILQSMHESPPVIMDDSCRALLVSLTNKNVTNELEKKLEGLVNNLQEEKQNFNRFEMKLNETLRSEAESSKTIKQPSLLHERVFALNNRK
jgi:hypothetical protein